MPGSSYVTAPRSSAFDREYTDSPATLQNLSAVEADVSDLDDRLEDAETALTAAESDIDDLEADVADHETRIDALENP